MLVLPPVTTYVLRLLSKGYMVSRNVGMSAQTTRLSLWSLQLKSDILYFTTRAGITPSPTLCDFH